MLGEKLKKLRNDKGLLQKDVAEKIGVSAAMISKYETGQKYPSHETLVEITKFFNVSMNYLMSNSEIDNTINNTVYEQIRKYISEYEYEIFKRNKSNADSTELSKFLNTLKTLDDRATFEAYTNIDREVEYTECIIEMTKSIYYFKNFFETIVATINHETIDINKLEDESSLAIDIAKDTLNKLTEVSITSEEAIDELSHIEINYDKQIIDISKDDFTMPIAAHNDNLDEEQQEKMLRDIEKIKNKKKNI